MGRLTRSHVNIEVFGLRYLLKRPTASSCKHLKAKVFAFLGHFGVKLFHHQNSNRYGLDVWKEYIRGKSAQARGRDGRGYVKLFTLDIDGP